MLAIIAEQLAELVVLGLLVILPLAYFVGWLVTKDPRVFRAWARRHLMHK